MAAVDGKFRIALSLSGGGFRATLFHLGVIRFLRDAGLLRYVRHISAVSGGSITAAHVVQNWGRYTSSLDETFRKAADEIIALVQSDLRGRIVRRMPYSPVVWPWRRINYLEGAYRLFLNTDSIACGDDRPELSILTTNLSTGRPWSFDSVGFTEEPAAKRSERIPTTLPTAARRVAASSAFPAFFPSLKMTAKDLGFDNAAFPYPQFFTDGGVYDNLGVRKFMWLLERAGNDDATETIDVVLLSDAGHAFDWDISTGTSGLFRTVTRSMEIAMDRVGTLDLKEAMRHDPRFRLISIGAEVPKNGAPSILSEDVQRQLKSIRTDLDRFSNLEVRCLVRHGYCVSRVAWADLLSLSQSSPASLSQELVERLACVERRDLQALKPWDPLECPSPRNDQEHEKDAEVDSFAPPSAVPALQRSQRLKARLFAVRDWVTYLNIALLCLAIGASYFILSIVFRKDSPDYLARSYVETIEISPPAEGGSADARGSMVRTIEADFIKLKDDKRVLERGAATTGDRIEATLLRPAVPTEFPESRLTFPGVMLHEYVLKIPLAYDPALAAQPVSYQFRFINNLHVGSDWIYFIPAFPIEHFTWTIHFPERRPCRHLVLIKVAESGVKKEVLFDSAQFSGHPSNFQWAPAGRFFVWTVNALKPEPAGYRVDFEW